MEIRIMTIITLKDINTGEKLRVRSFIDPVVNFLNSEYIQIEQKIRWVYEFNGEDVHPNFHEVLNLQEPKRFVGREHIIDKIE